MTSQGRLDPRGGPGSDKHKSPAVFYQNLVGVLAPHQPAVVSPGSSSTSNTVAKQAHRVFRKGGVITSLDEYTSISSSTANDVASASHPSTAAPASLGPQIGFSNVGYQLLKRAGWQEGQGLGSSQQGRSIPLAACHQQARQGIGVPTQSADVSHQVQHKQLKSVARCKIAAEQQGQAAKQKQLLPVPDVPEALDVKRKRHQQMIQTEADEEERKAIQRHVFRAFNDFGGEATSDSNPLARPTKLTRTNPLL